MTDVVMPLFAPMYTIGSERAEVRWLSIVYQTDSRRLDELLPRPLALSEPEVIIWVADFVSAKFEGAAGSRTLPRYTQGGVAVRARHDEQEVAYPLVSYITGLNHGFTGRELFGLPKKQALDVTLHEDGSSITTSITTANGTAIVQAAGTVESETAADVLTPEWFGRQRTIKLIPSVTGTGYDVNQLTAVPFTFADHRDVRAVQVDLRLTDSDADPIARLPQRGAPRAAIGSLTLGVGYGKYLGEPLSHPSWGRP